MTGRGTRLVSSELKDFALFSWPTHHTAKSGNKIEKMLKQWQIACSLNEAILAIPTQKDKGNLLLGLLNGMRGFG